MNDSPPVQWYHSWVIILLCILIYPLIPIALILLIQRIRRDRAIRILAGGILAADGWILMIFSSLLIFAALVANTSGDQTMAVLVVFGILGLIGLALIAKGRSLKREGTQLKRYISIVVNQGVTSLVDITTMMDTGSTDRAIHDLQELISDGFLPSYRIDPSAGTITRILPAHDPYQATATPAPPSVNATELAFSCKSCGANNRVTVAPGSLAECEYCGCAHQG